MHKLTYKEIIKIVPKDKPFVIEVESNPYGEGEHQVLWAKIDTDGYLNTYRTDEGRFDIDGVDYGWAGNWEDRYEGKFRLIYPLYEKPEVLKKGTKVQILESAKDCGAYDESTDKEDIGKIGEIISVSDIAKGVSYQIDFNDGNYPSTFPHYCVAPIKEERTLEDILASLSDEDRKIIRSKLQ